MSIVSSSQRSVKSSTVGKPKVVRFQLNYNLKSLFLDFVTEKDRKLYEDLVCHIRDVGQEIRDDDLVQLLKEARGCISILDNNFRLFVQVVLILKWTHRSDEVVSEYQGFLLELCSAHNYYTKLVIDHLVTSFKSVGDPENWIDFIPSESDRKCIEHIHHVIKAVLRVIPMSKDLLLTSIMNNYPYLKKPPHEQGSYIYNLLQIINYESLLKTKIFNLIVSKVIAIDVHTPRSELEGSQEEAMEVEEEGVFEMEDEQKKQPSMGQSLDVCLVVIFRFLKEECYDNEGVLIWEKTKQLYTEIVNVFENLILPTHAIHHTQFIVFYFLSFKATLAFAFLQMLWKKVTTPSIAPVFRQSAVSYIASLLARAAYVSVHTVQDILSELTTWLHSYIDCQDGGVDFSQSTKVHMVFFATCQALFYVIAFRYRELVDAHKGLAFLQNLNLSKIVTCRLNPLRVCQSAVVTNFASVARAYQLAYCYTIIERNSRSALPQVQRDATGAITSVSQAHLESFFPFDPYLLTDSESFIEPIYREYKGLQDAAEGSGETSQADAKDEDVDDFLESTIILHEPSPLSSFSYGTSPGFLQV